MQANGVATFQQTLQHQQKMVVGWKKDYRVHFIS